MVFVKDTRIFYKENFLSLDDIKFLENKIIEHKSHIDSLIELSKKEAVNSFSSSHAKIRNIRIVSGDEDIKVLNNILEKIKEEIRTYIDSSVNKMWLRPLEDIHCHYPPLHLYEHYDSKDEVGKNIAYGIVLYLTDSYEGGELTYTKKQISIKPQKGSLIVHPSSEEYTHKVETISSGIRITIPSFAYA